MPYLVIKTVTVSDKREWWHVRRILITIPFGTQTDTLPTIRIDADKDLVQQPKLHNSAVANATSATVCRGLSWWLVCDVVAAVTTAGTLKMAMVIGLPFWQRFFRYSETFNNQRIYLNKQ